MALDASDRLNQSIEVKEGRWLILLLLLWLQLLLSSVDGVSVRANKCQKHSVDCFGVTANQCKKQFLFEVLNS